MNPQARRQNDNEVSEVREAFSPVWVGCVSSPLTLALARRERERASCVFSIRASFSLAPCAHRFNAETPAQPSAFDSPRSGGRFSLSPRERAGVRGKSRDPVDQIHVQCFDATPHPVPLPFPRGEGIHHRSVANPADSLVKVKHSRWLLVAMLCVLWHGGEAFA